MEFVWACFRSAHRSFFFLIFDFQNSHSYIYHRWETEFEAWAEGGGWRETGVIGGGGGGSGSEEEDACREGVVEARFPQLMKRAEESALVTVREVRKGEGGRGVGGGDGGDGEGGSAGGGGGGGVGDALEGSEAVIACKLVVKSSAEVNTLWPFYHCNTRV